MYGGRLRQSLSHLGGNLDGIDLQRLHDNAHDVMNARERACLTEMIRSPASLLPCGR